MVLQLAVVLTWPAQADPSLSALHWIWAVILGVLAFRGLYSGPSAKQGRPRPK